MAALPAGGRGAKVLIIGGTGFLGTELVRRSSALWELALSGRAGMCHLAGADALSRHELGVLLARRDGLDATRLPAGRRADTALPGALDVRLDSSATQGRLRTRLRGAREFLHVSG